MTIIEALKTGLPVIINRTLIFINSNPIDCSHSYVIPDSWIDPEYLLANVRFDKEMLLSNDWQVMNGEKNNTQKNKTPRRSSKGITRRNKKVKKRTS